MANGRSARRLGIVASVVAIVASSCTLIGRPSGDPPASPSVQVTCNNREGATAPSTRVPHPTPQSAPAVTAGESPHGLPVTP